MQEESAALDPSTYVPYTYDDSDTTTDAGTEADTGLGSALGGTDSGATPRDPAGSGYASRLDIGSAPYTGPPLETAPPAPVVAPPPAGAPQGDGQVTGDPLVAGSDSDRVAALLPSGRLPGSQSPRPYGLPVALAGVLALGAASLLARVALSRRKAPGTPGS